ncbi:MAG: GntR family transcriptional regulator [Paracoccaceae bacterium]
MPPARAVEALAEEFGISRTPLRRVLTKLEAEGLVRAVHGVGTFGDDVDLEALAQTYQLRLELTGLTARLDPDAARCRALGAVPRRARGGAGAGDATEPARLCRLNIGSFAPGWR